MPVRAESNIYKENRNIINKRKVSEHLWLSRDNSFAATWGCTDININSEEL